jgi:hypothetical protein
MARPMNLTFVSDTGYGRLAGLGTTITRPGFVGPVDDPSGVFYVGANATPQSVVSDLSDWLGISQQAVLSDAGIMSQVQAAFSTPEGASGIPGGYRVSPTAMQIDNWFQNNKQVAIYGGLVLLGMMLMRK